MINFLRLEAVQVIPNFKCRKKSVKNPVKIISHGIISKNRNKRMKMIMIMTMTAWNVINLNPQSYQFAHNK